MKKRLPKERPTLAEWIRQAIRTVRRQKSRVPPERKLALVRAAMKHSFPTADIDQMLAEIEKGRVASKE